MPQLYLFLISSPLPPLRSELDHVSLPLPPLPSPHLGLSLITCPCTTVLDLIIMYCNLQKICSCDKLRWLLKEGTRAYSDILHMPHTPHVPHMPHTPHVYYTPHIPHMPHVPHIPHVSHPSHASHVSHTISLAHKYSVSLSCTSLCNNSKQCLP